MFADPLLPLYLRMQASSSLDEYKKVDEFIKNMNKEREEKEKKQQKPPMISIMQAFFWTTFLSIPVGMATSWMLLNILKMWHDSVGSMIK